MLAAINVFFIREIDLNVVLEKVEKAQEHNVMFPSSFTQNNIGETGGFQWKEGYCWRNDTKFNPIKVN